MELEEGLVTDRRRADTADKESDGTDKEMGRKSWRRTCDMLGVDTMLDHRVVQCGEAGAVYHNRDIEETIRSGMSSSRIPSSTYRRYL